MKKINSFIITAIFGAFFLGFFILNLFSPDTKFSAQENRYLQTLPEFSYTSLLSGSFTGQFEEYCSDQFAFRDYWISLKAKLELLEGKNENNGIYLCDNRLIKPFSQPEESTTNNKISVLNNFSELSPVPVYVCLIPGTSEIYREIMPHGADNDSQRDYVESVYNALQTNTVNVFDKLEQHKNEYIYYRTDHHWTSLGAYYAAEELADSICTSPIPTAPPSETVVSDSFYGTLYSSSGITWIQPDRISVISPKPDGLRIVRVENNRETETDLYNSDALSQKDKYQFFLGGNTPEIIINNSSASSNEKLLVIRDSYFDSLAPHLIYSFSEIHCLDLRYFHASVQKYIAENDFTSVLIIYSVDNFSEDNNLALLNY